MISLIDNFPTPLLQDILKNISDEELENIVMKDYIPAGFKLINFECL